MKICLKLIIVVFIAVVVVSCSNDNDGQIDGNSVVDTTEITIEAEILRLVNEYRVSIKLPELKINTVAKTLAMEHTVYMIAKTAISHDNFDSRFKKLRTEANATSAAENVASFQPTAQSVVDAWLNSAGHRKNIEGNFFFTGISASKDDQGQYYYTQIFHN